MNNETGVFIREGDRHVRAYTTTSEFLNRFFQLVKETGVRIDFDHPTDCLAYLGEPKESCGANYDLIRASRFLERRAVAHGNPRYLDLSHQAFVKQKEPILGEVITLDDSIILAAQVTLHNCDSGHAVVGVTEIKEGLKRAYHATKSKQTWARGQDVYVDEFKGLNPEEGEIIDPTPWLKRIIELYSETQK